MNFTALEKDTDCDGTTFSARRIVAENREAAWEILNKRGDCYELQHELEFLLSTTYCELDKWDRDYYIKEGYCSLGASWNPWVYDDSIGIPALDTTYDDPIYNDADIEQAQWEAECR